MEMNKDRFQVRREGFLASKVSECKYPNGKLREEWMFGFREGQDFLKRVDAMRCSICGEIEHAPGCPQDMDE